MYIIFIFIFITLLIIHDYNKLPIDKLYFKNPKRVLMGIQNSLIDILDYKKHYQTLDYQSLNILQDNVDIIKNEYIALSDKLDRIYFHDIDIWFSYNPNYFFYKCSDFPQTNKLLSQIPSVLHDSAIFAVMIGPHIIPPHKADLNYYLRYQLTILNEDQGDRRSWLEMENDKYYHDEGDSIVFDHSRNHSVYKDTMGTRVVLIADIKRFA